MLTVSSSWSIDHDLAPAIVGAPLVARVVGGRLIGLPLVKFCFRRDRDEGAVVSPRPRRPYSTFRASHVMQ
jgi:hypothetical protein